MADIRHAQCHCGAVAFTVELTDGLNTARRCSCSFCPRGIQAVSQFDGKSHRTTVALCMTNVSHWLYPFSCRMRGAVVVSAPLSGITVTRGEDKLTEYRFNTGTARSNGDTFLKQATLTPYSFGLERR
jgi:hypothetical protein